MAEEKQNRGGYHLYANTSRPFFSFKKPAEGQSAHNRLEVQVHNGNIQMKFTRFITNENQTQLICWMPDYRVHDLCYILGGIIARRRVAYEKGENYSTDEVWTFPVVSFQNGQERETGFLRVDTELIDGVPRIRLTYRDDDANDSIEIVFCDRKPTTEVKGGNLEQIDYVDARLFKFYDLLDNIVNDPQTMIMYHMADSLMGAITKYIGACFRGSSNNNQNNGNGYRNNNNRPAPQSQDVPDDYDPY